MSSDKAIVAGLRAQWEQGQLLDFTIDVEGRSFRVNKCVMSAVSDYFRAMVTTGLDESLKDSVKLEAVSVVAMEHLIHFVYKDNMELTKANVAEVLDGAVYLQMHSAITVCTDFMLDNLDATLCYEVLSVFQNYSLQDGISKIRSYIKANMKTIVAECDPGVISYDECCFIINNWQENEVDLFYFVKKWLDADPGKRDQYLMELMSGIRFCLMTREELTILEKRYQMSLDSSGTPAPWFPMLEYALKYHDLPVHRRVLDDSEQTRVRGQATLTVFCAESDAQGCYILEANKQWKEKPNFSLPKDDAQTIANVEVNNFFLVVSCTSMLMFDPRTLTWTELAPMLVKKAGFVMVHHASCLYVLGGLSDRGVVVDTVERYDFQTNEWSSFTTLPDRRFLHAACVYQDSIYVSGGLQSPLQQAGSQKSLYKLDCANLSAIEWQSKAPMLEGQSDHKMYTMKLNGEEVICVFATEFQVQYYEPASDQWSRFEFSCYYRLPKNISEGMVITQGNTLYFIDNIREGVWNNNGLCYKLTFPEISSVKMIKHFNPIVDAFVHSMDLCGAVLVLPSYNKKKQC